MFSSGCVKNIVAASRRADKILVACAGIAYHIGMSTIKDIRERLGLTQKELGAILGCGAPSISWYEKGDVPIPLPRANRLIAEAGWRGLRLTLDQVYGRSPLPSVRRKHGRKT